MLGDKAYDSAELRDDLHERGTKPVIPNRCNRKQPFSFSRRIYKLRWRIESAFNRLKDFRRIATRYDRLARNYLASVCLTIPILFTQITDPVSSGIVASLARPGGNVTGFAPAEFSMYGKLLETLKEAAPNLTRVAIVMNPEQIPQVGMSRAIEAAAPSLGLKTVNLSVRGSIEDNFASFAQERDGGLVVLPNPVADNNRELIIRTAARRGLPAIYAYRFYATSGGLLSYGIDTADQFIKAASYVDRMLKGAKPADLPVQQPTKYELVINLKTAKALGLDVPPSLLARADEVIE